MLERVSSTAKLWRQRGRDGSSVLDWVSSGPS